jgi:tetratricopeptide (TPR) repeat protein
MTHSSDGRPAFWHYDWLRTENYLNPVDIEEQGKFLLYRGLNLGRLIAFLGSGVSTAYGRVTWAELGLVVLQGVEAFRDRLGALPPKVHDDTALGGLLDRVLSLREQVLSGRGEEITLAMHLAERIFAHVTESFANEPVVLHELAIIFRLNPLHLDGKPGPELGRKVFRQIIRQETYDEVAYVRRLLSSAWRIADRRLEPDAVDALASKYEIDRLDRFRNRIRHRQARMLFASALFGASGAVPACAREVIKPRTACEGSLPALAGALVDKILTFLAEEAARMKPAQAGRDRNGPVVATRVLRPSAWPAVALLLDVLRYLIYEPPEEAVAPRPEGPRHLRQGDQRAKAALVSCSLSRSPALRKIAKALAKSAGKPDPAETVAGDSTGGHGDGVGGPNERARLIPHDHDPLWQLAIALGVTRFATLNFDLEIERLLQDALFQQTDYPDQAHLSEREIERFGPLGGRARDFVLGPTTIADFIDFASGEGPYDYQVVHLHGRSTDQDEVVLTERDYQRIYVGEDASHEAMHAGFEVMFGGNPVLFVGVGLSEGDVLRPLREFASGRTRRNRAIIALRDGSEEPERRDYFTLQQYIRYGAYIIHYGKRTHGEKRHGSETDRNEQFWLHLLTAYCGSLKALARQLGERSSAVSVKQTKPLIDKLNRLSEDLRDKSEKLFKHLPDPSKSQEIFESDGAPCDIRFELKLLQAIDTFCTQCIEAELDERSKTVFEIVVTRAVDRALSAAKTAALNARLQALKVDWTDWWRDWRTAPKPRMVTVRRPAKWQYEPSLLAPLRDFRHVVKEPVEAEGPSWAMRDFLDAVPRLGDSETRGRLFVLSAPRGAGKGSLFAEFARHADLILEGSRSPDAQEPPRRYAGFYMAGFSFSPETASVWDHLTVLFGATPGAVRKEGGPRDKPPGRGRIEHLRFALKELSKTADDVAKHFARSANEWQRTMPRYLLVFNGFDLLFHANGYPKNAEIRAICDVLFNEAREAPLDIVILFRDNVVPLYFRGPSSAAEHASHRALCRGRTFRLMLSESDRHGQTSIERQAYITSVLGRHDIAVVGASDEQFLELSRHVAPARAGLPQVADDGHYFRVLHRSYVDDLLNTSKARALVKEFDKFLAGRKEGANVRNARELLRMHLGNSRYRMSIMLAIFDSYERCRKANRKLAESERMALHGLLDAIGRGVGIQWEAPTDRFFTEVIDYWSHRKAYPEEQLAAIRDAAGAYCQPNPGALDSGRTVCAADPVMQEELLRHLAVIAVPVAADVVAVAPRLKEACHLALKTPGPDLDAKTVIEMVRAALAILWKRGLALLTENEQLRDGDRTRIEPRYTVHRSLQFYVYRKLGSQETEPADAFAFTVSLYAAQTRSLPSLSSNAYAFLNQFIDALIGYPSRSPPVPTDGFIRARALRAALGIARTLYSLGVVARFADLPGLERPDPPRLGYFERHRLALRWMLEQAKEHDKDTDSAIKNLSDAKAKAECQTERAHHRPFYRDDIVWLYNECGVFSLAQGQLHDAGALFSMAKRGARGIEGTVVGPIGRRIRMNSALAALERGRFGQAARDWSEIIGTPDEDETVRMTARGYMGLLHHIGGDASTAMVCYDAAIARLESLKRPRPVSIFLRHRGNLLRSLNKLGDARRDIERAYATASAAGLQDLLWLAHVELAALDIHDPQKRGDSGAIIKKLEEAEKYADKMDIPRLTCHVMSVYASLLLAQGETGRAGQLVTRALRIATLNGMTLRGISFRILLASIRRARGRMEEADRIRDQALAAARRIGYRPKGGMEGP